MGKGFSGDWACVREEEGAPLTGMNNGKGAEVAGALSADSALSSPQLAPPGGVPTRTCLPSPGRPCGLDQAGAGQEPGLRLPREGEQGQSGKDHSPLLTGGETGLERHREWSLVTRG